MGRRGLKRSNDITGESDLRGVQVPGRAPIIAA